MRETNGQNYSSAQPMIEVLEERQFMSVAAHPAVHATKTPTPAPIVMAAHPVTKPAPKVVAKPAPKPVVKPAAKPVAKPAAKAVANPVVADLPAYVPDAHPGLSPSVVGGWTGTMTTDGQKQGADFSINFEFQRGVAASGTFDLGTTVNNQTVTSTMVFGTNHNVRILILTPTLWMGFTGALTANGKILYGRFSVNTANGWKTGSFSLTRN
jgi:hypothetical protein